LKGLSNRGWAFIFNKTPRGVGSLAEERRQRAAEIAEETQHQGRGVATRSLEPYANRGEIAEVYANLCPSTRKPRVNGARLGWSGMTSLKPTPIWDDPGRGGY
jgi:hypothetical protein